MNGARARAVFALAALAGLATTCGRESVTALDLKMMPTGSVDGVQLQSVSLTDGQVTLNSDQRDFGNPPRLLTSNDVLTVWFSDSADGKRATAMLLGFRCGVPIGAPVTTAEVVLRKGQTVTALVRLDGPNMPTCANTDGGIGGRGGSGAGGAGGAGGGPTGGTGGGGRGGSAGSTGATGGGGASGAAGTGGTLGTAGTTGTAGRGGTTGTAGTIGAAGRGGTTGAAGRGGTTGAAGRGGTTGAGGRGGSSCTATGPESCFNNLDDDCDGNVDCMDSDCNGRAVCVQLDPGLGPLGVVMPGAQAQCPTDYASATTINSGTPMGGQCSGCNCTPPQTSCIADFYDYTSYQLCTADPAMQKRVGQWNSGLGCNNNAVWDVEPTSGSVFGVAVGPITPQYAGCNATGTATAGPPTWTNTSKFCATAMAGGGCGTGSACLPAISNMPQRCLLALSGASCPAGTTRSDWYTGYTGNYACNPCMCGPTSGGSCANVTLYVGTNSPTCALNAQFAGLTSGGHVCASPGTLMNPSIMFMGTPTAPTCQPSYTTSGSLTPTGSQVVCCR